MPFMATLLTDNGTGTFKTGTLEQGAYNGTLDVFEINQDPAPAVAPSNKVPITSPLTFLKLTGTRHRQWLLQTRCL